MVTIGEGPDNLARKRTLTPAAAGTAVLWAATIVSTVIGPGRLHLTLLAASLVASLVASGAFLAARREERIERRIAQIRADMADTVRQGFDELHSAVEDWGETLRQDRKTLAAVRVLTAELVQHRQKHRDRVA